MTRKDYVTLSKALRNAKPGSHPDYSPQYSHGAHSAWLAAVCGVADALTKDNPNCFDSDRFLTACGVSQ